MTTVKLVMSLTVFLYILMIMHKIDLKVEKRREKLQYMSLKCPCNVIKKWLIFQLISQIIKTFNNLVVVFVFFFFH